ncbi:hypothetical protein R84981_002419 [Carnimonas sp. R-84981]
MSVSEGQARQKSAIKPDSFNADEQFELIFNAAWPTASSFQTKPNGGCPPSLPIQEKDHDVETTGTARDC